MAHYFDDIFHRHEGGMQTPKSPSSPRLRRTSTSRSIAARSDFDSNDLNGFEDEGDGDFPTRRGSLSHGVLMAADPERLREKREADNHMHAYISSQLERVKLEQSADGYSTGEEFEAQPDN